MDTRTLIILNVLMTAVLLAAAVVLAGKVQNLETQVNQSPVGRLLGGL
jgi:hypothetical protein